jgi:hypothetical protein
MIAETSVTPPAYDDARPDQGKQEMARRPSNTAASGNVENGLKTWARARFQAKNAKNPGFFANL